MKLYGKLLKGYWLLLLMFMAVAFPLGAIGQDKPCVMKMVWEPWPPYQYRSEQGEMTGLDIELVSAVVEEMGCKLELYRRPWVRGLRELESGLLDIQAGASVTAERQAWAYFSDPYRQEVMSLFVLKGKSGQYPLGSLGDIVEMDFSLGINRGTFYGDEFEGLMESYPFIRSTHTFNTEKQKVKALLIGRVDGLIGNPVSTFHILRGLDAVDDVEIHPLKIHSANQHVIFSKESTSAELVKRFNDALRRLKQTGEHQQITLKYLK
ncbi:substrate-binding periplasmic protein [Dongshaea marina]|uniref:substrate-binding periplasmic protein n=1 Tax=Dongshaea marina TaxID=2047966 RepID=UPI000D3EA96F|nr:transporter substrate-binding domain-containing protein [Dongshaea marina]